MTAILPELITVLAGFSVLLSDLFVPKRSKWLLPAISLLGFALALGALVGVMPAETTLFGGRFALTPVAAWFKVVFLLAGGFTVALAWDQVRANRLRSDGEFLAIIHFVVTGMMLLISVRDLISLYVCLELATIPLFALAAWTKGDSQSSEAGLKYAVLGALSSSLLVFGLALLFGLTGGTSLELIGFQAANSPLFWLASALIIAGVGFKLTLVPFHMWAADVYQGAPTPVTAFLSVASKGAGLAFMFQLFFGVFGDHLSDWGWLIAILAAITMTLGNLVAIIQENIKRFMAFSAISQAGYLLIGFLGAFSESAPAMLFYMLVYLFSNMAVFAVIVFYSNAAGRENISDYDGLSRLNPIVALVMMLALFSLAGVPPLAGFVGKFFLFSIAAGAGHHWLVALAALNSTVSLYYYLRIVRRMYIEPVKNGDTTFAVHGLTRCTLGLATIGVILLGVIPTFYEAIHKQTGSSASDVAAKIKPEAVAKR
jgi:NADH-quinone oxidoreductase subunit N